MIFDGLADLYDRYRIGYATQVYEMLAQYGLGPAQRVLDVGCGTGISSGELTTRGYDVTGIDVSESMLIHARRHFPTTTFVQGSAESLPFVDNSFDATTCAQSFHWFKPQAALAEFARVVRPGGVVAVWWKSILPGDPVRIARDEAAHELGFDAAQADELLPDGLPEFEQAGFLERTLRVIPALVTMHAEEFLGYERSRARARKLFGDRVPDYLACLRAKFGDSRAMLAISYVQYLYLGKVPGRAAG